MLVDTCNIVPVTEKGTYEVEMPELARECQRLSDVIDLRPKYQTELPGLCSI